MAKLLSILVAILALGLGCTSSCVKQKAEGQIEEQAAGDVAAIINGNSIPMEKLNDYHRRTVDQLMRTGRQVPPELDQKLRGSILKKLLDDQMVKQKVDSASIKIDRFERVEALEKYKASMGGEQAFQAFLKQRELNEEQVLDSLMGDLAKDKLLKSMAKAQVSVSEQEIKSYYEANKKLYSMPESVHARHILLKINKDDPQEKVDLVFKKAQMILEEAKKAPETFAELVQKYSEGPSSANKGSLGFFPRGRMVKEFEDAAFNAPIKTPVGPIKTDYGYHIIFVEEKKEAYTAPIEEVKDRIVESIKNAKQSRESQEVLASLRKTAKIQLFDKSLTEAEYRDSAHEEQVHTKASR